jgi:hypothetical protein
VAIEIALKAFGVHDSPAAFVLSEVCYGSPKRLLSGAVLKQADEWKCPSCTFFNSATHVQCERCETLDAGHLLRTELSSEDLDHNDRISSHLQM